MLIISHGVSKIYVSRLFIYFEKQKIILLQRYEKCVLFFCAPFVHSIFISDKELGSYSPDASRNVRGLQVKWPLISSDLNKRLNGAIYIYIYSIFSKIGLTEVDSAVLELSTYERSYGRTARRIDFNRYSAGVGTSCE